MGLLGRIPGWLYPWLFACDWMNLFMNVYVGGWMDA